MSHGSINADELIGVRWRKSSRSNNQTNCVEVAVLTGARWRKSSRSNNAASCVEVAAGGAVTGVRDSKNPHGPALLFPSTAFADLLTDVAGGNRPIR